MNNKSEIVICMGSSCFSRGNKENYQRILQYLKINSLGAKVNFKGKHCVNKCSEGPIMIINGVEHKKVMPDDISFILSSYLNKE